MKPPIQLLKSIPAIDGGFVVSVPIPAAMKAHFEAARWRAHLDGQMECWHGCAVAGLRSGRADMQAIGARAGLSRWKIDKPALKAFRGHRLESIELRFRLDPADTWNRLGSAIGVSPVRLLQAALATRYRQSMEFAALARVERENGIASGAIIAMAAALA